MLKREAPSDASPWKGLAEPRPDLLVRFTTAAGFPPYSALTPPVMTSMLSTWEGSSEFEKVDCTWSVMGTPSTTKVTCPWLPRKWKRPFSSWMKPGVVRRMLSMARLWTAAGIFSMVDRSMSMWAEGWASTRDTVSSTATVAEA